MMWTRAAIYWWAGFLGLEHFMKIQFHDIGYTNMAYINWSGIFVIKEMALYKFWNLQFSIANLNF